MSEQDKIPFLDLVGLHSEIENELITVFKRALETGGFVGGPMVQDFEQDFAQYCDTEFCVGVSSGTDALRFALMGAGVKPGETVVTVPNSFIATTEAITQAGAQFEFVDIDEDTYNLSPAKLEEYLQIRCFVDATSGKLMSRRTGSAVAAVVPVHLYGQPADMDAILALAQRHRLLVIEDACQAHGTEYYSAREKRWFKAGSMGVAAAFSFYPGKNLGALGEGGAVTTNLDSIAQAARRLRQHGELKRYHHESEGYNGRLDAIQAGFLQTKLKHLPAWVEARRKVADRYQEFLAPLVDRVRLPYVPSWARAAWHLYVIRVANRGALRKSLDEAGIGTGIHYPIPLHLQAAYRPMGYKEGDFPEAEKVAKEILSLPMYPQLDSRQQNKVAESVLEYMSMTPVASAGSK